MWPPHRESGSAAENRDPDAFPSRRAARVAIVEDRGRRRQTIAKAGVLTRLRILFSIRLDERMHVTRLALAAIAAKDAGRAWSCALSRPSRRAPASSPRRSGLGLVLRGRAASVVRADPRRTSRRRRRADVPPPKPVHGRRERTRLRDEAFKFGVNDHAACSHRGAYEILLVGDPDARQQERYARTLRCGKARPAAPRDGRNQREHGGGIADVKTQLVRAFRSTSAQRACATSTSRRMLARRSSNWIVVPTRAR